MSYELLQIVWILTKVFFILSLILLGLFFMFKKMFDLKKASLSKKTLSTKEICKKKYVSFEKEQDVLIYAKSIGEILLNTTDNEKCMQIKKHIHEIHLYPKIYALYTDTNIKILRLYFLSLIVTLAQEESRALYYNILSDEKTKDTPQFYNLAVLGLALSSKNKEDITTFYQVLLELEQEKEISQKLSQFFFIQAFKSVGYSVCISFFSDFFPIKITSTTNAMIYALQDIPSSEKIEDILLKWHYRFPENTMLLVAILRVFYTHKSKHYKLIIDHHDNKNDLIRVVCSKVGIDLLPKEDLGILTHYLCDDNIHVRKNFLVSLTQHSISFKDIYHKTMQYYPQCLKTQQSCSSLEAYKKGLL